MWTSKEHKLSSLWTNYQIEALNPNGEHICGTGPCFAFKGAPYILTCAHNVVTVDRSDSSESSLKMHYHTDLTAYETRGAGSYVGKFKISHIVVHPLYNGTPICGFDLAILFIGPQVGPPKNLNKQNYCMDVQTRVDHARFCADPAQLKESMPLTISGYAAEKDDQLCEHSGQLL